VLLLILALTDLSGRLQETLTNAPSIEANAQMDQARAKAPDKRHSQIVCPSSPSTSDRAALSFYIGCENSRSANNRRKWETVNAKQMHDLSVSMVGTDE
jgi:hypothetical protein